MKRVRQNRLGHSALDYSTLVQDIDDFTALSNAVEVVADQKDRRLFPARQRDQRIQHLGAHGGVQGRCGFISDDESGPAKERHGNQDALTHATAQLMRPCLKNRLRIGNTHVAQGFQRQRRLINRIRDVGAHHVAQLLTDSNGRVERLHRLLKDGGDLLAAQLAAPGLRGSQKVLAPPQNLTRAGNALLRQQAIDRRANHRLARSRLSCHTNDLALSNVQ